MNANRETYFLDRDRPNKRHHIDTRPRGRNPVRTSSLRLVMLLFILLPGMQVLATQSLAQTPESGSTPELPMDDANQPKFGIVALGDNPTGYFDDIEVAPGTSIELSVAIVNSGASLLELRTYKVNALSNVNGGFVAGNEEDQPIGATSWIEYPTTELQIDAGKQQDISFTVNVPNDAAPGQYISGLVVETADSADISGSDVLRQVTRHVISVGILVPGELERSFELGEPVIESRFLQVSFTNSGNYLVRPAGEMTLTNADGEVVHTSRIEMGSVYAGLSTDVAVGLPEQTPPGDYTVDLTLTDEASGATATIEDAPVTVPEPVDPTGVSAISTSIEPNADPIVFANVAVTLNNGGQQIPATNVTLNVMRDGEEVESFPLATNQVLPSGETEITSRYIPAEAWEPGTYTFEIVVSAVDPEGGTETILAIIDVEDEIVVP